MINTFLSLANELGIKHPQSLGKKLGHTVGEELIIKKMEQEFDNSLFSYKMISNQISHNTKINSPFVVSVNGVYELIKYANGLYYNRLGQVELDNYIGCRFFSIRSISKIKKPSDLVSDIVNFTPVWSLFLLLLTPFALITPIYTNIFNTRLIYSSSVSTLIVVSVFFLFAYVLEFFAKKYIKDKCIQANGESALKFETYILGFTSRYKGFFAVHSIKTVEQYRKMVWEFIPYIACDILSFIMFFITLSIFISWLSVYFLLFYAVVFVIFYLYRSKLYKYLIDQESSSNDVLKLRISNIFNRDSIPFINKFSVFSKYLRVYGVSQHYEDKITRFNFFWDELTKMVSFLALFVLFFISFVSISASELNPAYMIVLFIISSRLSGLMSQIVTRLSYLKASFIHLHQSMEGLFTEEVLESNVSKIGMNIEELDKIKVSNLALSCDQKTLLKNINLKFHKGILYGIKGPVGSGKSTLLKSILGINKDYKGKVEYDGVDMNVIDNNFFETKVSYLSSEASFLSGSLYENFLFRNCTSSKIINNILKECFGDRVFDYQSLYVDDIENIAMSTGQKRRLLFMMSLLDRSLLYVFDEVLVNMSKGDISRSIEYIRKYNSNAITIMVSHNESILSACDVVYEISRGTLSSQV
ncbi:ATP-binding cassette domain-containing protein [Vibrio splendidus]|uniref:ATP-binding cassette domain-containing protein n=1 Tax=Vibrio splendidus TaxID=29497 RepID=UPI000D3DBA96|nr:ATP-binding cassette domain-containing protein [Vibrio splendidus]PTO57751.1 hypothetical protein CWN82_13755 [Vibrio splendidus]PTO66163.1 hypothetical protein CWN99_07595 [Vibrio splendidus]PTP00832.1 hypothetical protein CWN88_13490 [Vibrio splendidus]PTP38856.1 hypothetical protein CWN87_23545 [Vibrio splendidus]PTQ05428.1 hypothetical protein CWO28_12965 [Vibrio splendidus]